VENGAQIIDINMDEGMLDRACMVRFLMLIASEPVFCKVTIMVDSSKWEVMRPGSSAFRNSPSSTPSHEEGVEMFIALALLVRRSEPRQRHGI
jgi:5-methyltetrahydrofolate--homocysteine methyltransferase